MVFPGFYLKSWLGYPIFKTLPIFEVRPSKHSLSLSSEAYSRAHSVVQFCSTICVSFRPNPFYATGTLDMYVEVLTSLIRKELKTDFRFDLVDQLEGTLKSGASRDQIARSVSDLLESDWPVLSLLALGLSAGNGPPDSRPPDSQLPPHPPDMESPHFLSSSVLSFQERCEVCLRGSSRQRFVRVLLIVALTAIVDSFRRRRAEWTKLFKLVRRSRRLVKGARELKRRGDAVCAELIAGSGEGTSTYDPRETIHEAIVTAKPDKSFRHR